MAGQQQCRRLRSRQTVQAPSRKDSTVTVCELHAGQAGHIGRDVTGVVTKENVANLDLAVVGGFVLESDFGPKFPIGKLLDHLPLLVGVVLVVKDIVVVVELLDEGD